MIGNFNFINATRKTIGSCLHQLNYLSSPNLAGGDLSSPARALAWIRAHSLPGGGVRVHSDHDGAYPEVTGYLIPTLLDYGERDLAKEFLRWLICVQRGDGSFCDPDEGRPHVFDTGQVLRGLLAGAGLVPGGMDSARRAADFLCREMTDEGRGGFGSRYEGVISESVHLYVLAPLIQAAQVFDEANYRLAAERCLDYYCGREDFLRKDDLTHFLAYQLEALIDLGRADRAKPVLDELARRQQPNGLVPGLGGARWACTPGLAQLALCWYKIGEDEPADRAMAWLEKHQLASGGFYGSYGRGATYFPKQELSWAVKFYLDAHRLRVRSFMTRNATLMPSHLSSDDGRVRTILEIIRPGDRVAEIGCGKGRFLRVIKTSHPRNVCAGVDIARAFLNEVPADIGRIESPMEALAIADDGFDVVFAVEAVEHSAHPQVAVAEMTRIAKPGGWVVIIDKQRSQWGRLACPSWERWPEMQRMKKWLNRGCDDVTASTVAYDGKTAADGLMVVWKGRKRSRLTGGRWNEVLGNTKGRTDVVRRIRGHQLFPWTQEIILATRPGDRVLEVGSGTGEISLALARAGRRVTIADISELSLEFTRQCAGELDLSLDAICADATEGFPQFPDGHFNCVWSSGLLEHFNADERRELLREWARLTCRQVIALVPRAGCLAYQVGKRIQEETGGWTYGQETPMESLRADFEAAGLRVEAEYSVGTQWALTFLPRRHPLRIPLADWLEGKTETELRELNQGYLLITKGIKPEVSLAPNEQEFWGGMQHRELKI